MNVNKKVLNNALTIAAMVGAVASPVIAVRGDRKARDGQTSTLKAYLPAAISTAVTVSCVAGSYYISKKQLAAVTAAGASMAAVLKEKYNELYSYMEEKHPEELDEFRKEQLEAEMENSPAPEYLETIEGVNPNDETVLCFDGYSGRWFYSTVDNVLWAEKVFNEYYRRDKYISLNDFYDLLHIEQTHFGAQYGWTSSQGYCPDEIRFENSWIDLKGDGKKVYCIEILDYPFESWFEI